MKTAFQGAIFSTVAHLHSTVNSDASSTARLNSGPNYSLLDKSAEWSAETDFGFKQPNWQFATTLFWHFFWH